MYVAGAVAIGFHDQQPHQLDDRGIGVVSGCAFRDRSVGRRPGQLDINVALGDLLEHALDRVVRRAVIPIQRGIDIVFRGNHRLDIHLQDVTQAVDGVHVERIADRHRQGIVVLVDRHHLVPPRNVAWHEGQNLIRNLVISQLDGIHPKLACQGLGHVQLGNFAQTNQRVDQAAIIGRGLLLGIRDVFVGHQTHITENLHYKFVLRRHGCCR